MKVCTIVLLLAIAFSCIACGKQENQKTESSGQAHEPEIRIDENVETATDTGDWTAVGLFKHVCTDDGSNLNFREKPIDGRILGRFKNGKTLQLSRRTKESYTIDGQSDYWYYACQYPDEQETGGWVFGAYLSDSPVYDELLGEWDSDNYHLRIENDGSITLGRKKREGLSGHWSLLNEETLLFTDAQTYNRHQRSFTWKIKGLEADRLTIDWNGSLFEFQFVSDSER